MTEPVVITISHRLGKAEAKARLAPALGSISRIMPMLTVEEEVWTDDRLSFRAKALGQAVSGSVTVAEDNVRFEVMLPWLLHRFAQTIQKTVTARGRILLEKK